MTLQACISLNSMYDLARAEGQPAPNEGEFRAYHLLLLMGTHGKYKYNSTEYRKALKVTPRLPSPHLFEACPAKLRASPPAMICNAFPLYSKLQTPNNLHGTPLTPCILSGEITDSGTLWQEVI